MNHIKGIQIFLAGIASEEVLPPQCGPEATCAVSEKAAPFSEKQNQEEEGALTLNSS